MSLWSGWGGSDAGCLKLLQDLDQPVLGIAEKIPGCRCAPPCTPVNGGYSGLAGKSEPIHGQEPGSGQRRRNSKPGNRADGPPG